MGVDGFPRRHWTSRTGRSYRTHRSCLHCSRSSGTSWRDRTHWCYRPTRAAGGRFDGSGSDWSNGSTRSCWTNRRARTDWVNGSTRRNWCDRGAGTGRSRFNCCRTSWTNRRNWSHRSTRSDRTGGTARSGRSNWSDRFGWSAGRTGSDWSDRSARSRF